MWDEAGHLTVEMLKGEGVLVREGEGEDEERWCSTFFFLCEEEAFPDFVFFPFLLSRRLCASSGQFIAALFSRSLRSFLVLSFSRSSRCFAICVSLAARYVDAWITDVSNTNGLAGSPPASA